MNRTPPRHMLPRAYEGKDFPRKVGQLSSWVEGHFTFWLGQFQDLGSLTGERVQGDSSCSFMILLPDSPTVMFQQHRTGSKKFRNWPLSYEIQKALATQNAYQLPWGCKCVSTNFFRLLLPGQGASSPSSWGWIGLNELLLTNNVAREEC